MATADLHPRSSTVDGLCHCIPGSSWSEILFWGSTNAASMSPGI